MAKQSITFAQWVTNSISNLPNQVKGQATSLKTLFDKAALDIKNYIDTTLITELNGNNGANKIGLLNANIGADNVADGLEEVRRIAVQAQAGTIVDNSISDIKLASDVKVGSLATLDTTDKTNATSAINEAFQLATTANGTANIATSTVATVTTNLDILREPKLSTGSSVAYVVDTGGTFDRTKNNRLMFIPHTANTGSMTISEDGNTAKSAKKASGTSYVDVVANDIPQGAPTEFVWSVTNDFFILRPSVGGKKWATGTVLLTSNGFSITGLSFTPTLGFYFQYSGTPAKAVIGVLSKSSDIRLGGVSYNNVQGFINSAGTNALQAATAVFGVSSITNIDALGQATTNIRWYAFE